MRRGRDVVADLHRNVADNARERGGNIVVTKLRPLLRKLLTCLFSIVLRLRDGRFLRLYLRIYRPEACYRRLMSIFRDVQFLTADDALTLKLAGTLELNVRQLYIRFAVEGGRSGSFAIGVFGV